ncbi:MAG TPA: hypothetical protein VNI84_04985 [Pyrinomonadaceae bacterium]|nr:hypothetical protein [Pyrinomonadaceae bacterium]
MINTNAGRIVFVARNVVPKLVQAVRLFPASINPVFAHLRRGARKPLKTEQKGTYVKSST